MTGGSLMPEFMVAIDHITYYAVRAEDEVTAIDLVLEGQGLEISSETRDAQPSSRHPLLWWGMNSTLFGKYPLGPDPEPHGASSRALNAHESKDGNSPGYVDPTRSASFPTEVNNVVTRFAPRITTLYLPVENSLEHQA